MAAFRDDMVRAGVDWVDEATAIDGNLNSARPRPTSSMEALQAALAKVEIVSVWSELVEVE